MSLPERINDTNAAPWVIEEIKRIEAERDGWVESARHFANGQEFYQGIVRQVGNLFGEVAYTSDDGSVQDDVLALKVPELVEGLAAHVERLAALGSLIARNLDDGGSMEDLDDLLEKWPEAVSDAPTASLSRQKLRWQAEVLEEAGRFVRCEEDAALLRINAAELRRQAEGGEHGNT